MCFRDGVKELEQAEGMIGFKKDIVSAVEQINEEVQEKFNTSANLVDYIVHVSQPPQAMMEDRKQRLLLQLSSEIHLRYYNTGRPQETEPHFKTTYSFSNGAVFAGKQLSHRVAKGEQTHFTELKHIAQTELIEGLDLIQAAMALRGQLNPLLFSGGKHPNPAVQQWLEEVFITGPVGPD